MSADADIVYARKPFLLTLKGSVTVHFMDGQTLEGEIAAQDELNIWLTVDDAPHLLSRHQIRYIKGTAGQAIEPDTAEALLAEPPPSMLDTSPGVSKEEVEPSVAPAQFVEEVDFSPLDEGSTMVIPAGKAALPQGVEQTNVHAPVEVEADDDGITEIPLPQIEPPTVVSAEVSDLSELDDAPTPVNLEITELLPSLDLEDMDDATFVLSQTSDDEVSAHLVCTIGPHAGEVLKLRPGITTIGRSSDNSLPLSKDKEVSRRHSLIVYESKKFVIQDQNSLNGTFVNDQLVKEPRPLQDGDLILIGVSTLKFQEKSKK